MKKLSSLSDEQLVALCKSQDDPDAWTELSSRYLGIAMMQAKKLSNDPTQAEDLAQIGLIGFLNAVRSYNADTKTSFVTYASRCIRNRIINNLRSGNTGKYIPAQLCTPLDSLIDLADPAMTPEQVFLSQKETRHIGDIIRKSLTDKEREVFSLYLSGLKYSEIAERLDMSEKAVEGALSRARKKIKSEFC